MIIQERDSDTQTKYIFVKKFKYFDPSMSEALAGHPIEKRVYRSIYNINTQHHRVLLPDGAVMAFNKMVGVREDCEFDLAEITIDNILDFDIIEEDLEVFLEADKILIPAQQGFNQLMEALHNHGEDEVEFSERASDVVLSLYQVNPIKAEIIIQIASYLLDSDMQSHEDAAYNLKLSGNGLGLNIGAALIHLDRYASDNPRIAGDEDDLLDAVGAIATEMERLYNV